MEYFKDFAIPDGNVCFILVYYGSEGFSEIMNYLDSLQNQTGFKDYKIDHVLNEDFSRGRGTFIMMPVDLVEMFKLSTALLQPFNEEQS